MNTGRTARITAVEATKNGMVLAHVVRTLDNGSEYRLRGADVDDAGKIGDLISIQPIGRGAARRVKD